MIASNSMASPRRIAAVREAFSIIPSSGSRAPCNDQAPWNNNSSSRDDQVIGGPQPSTLEACTMKVNYLQVIGAGIAGTLVMTAVGLFVAPMMGLMKMNPADMLAMQMGNVAMLGWMAHLMIGVVLAI